MSREAGLNKAPDAFRTISEVAEELDLPQHVLRFWESRFPHVKPLKRGGGRRYYRPEDVDLLRGIRRLLYSDGYTIKGVQRILREQGVRAVQSVGQDQEMANLAPNLAALPRNNRANGGNWDEDGAPAAPDVLTPRTASPQDYRQTDDVGDTDDEAGKPAAQALVRPQNGPIHEARSAAAPVASESERIEQARIEQARVLADHAAAHRVAGGRPGIGQINAGQAAPAASRMTPAAARMPSPQHLTAQDLDRLKRALAELEACRRLLVGAVERER